MSPLPLEQQLMLARLAVHLEWIKSQDLMNALHGWSAGQLVDYLLDRKMLTTEQVAQLAGDRPQPEIVDPGSDTLVREGPHEKPRPNVAPTPPIREGNHGVPLERQLLVAHLALKRNWVRPEDRTRRWGRRHRTLVTSGVVLLLVSVLGLIVGLGAVNAERARTAEQRDDAVKNEQRAPKAEKEAKANLEVAEANLKLARKAVNDTFDLAKKHPLLQQQGMHEVRRLLLEKALPFYKRFRVLKGDAKSQAPGAARTPPTVPPVSLFSGCEPPTRPASSTPKRTAITSPKTPTSPRCEDVKISRRSSSPSNNAPCAPGRASHGYLTPLALVAPRRPPSPTPAPMQTALSAGPLSRHSSLPYPSPARYNGNTFRHKVSARIPAPRRWRGRGS